MAHDVHHEHLIKEVEALFDSILKKSPQAIYIYLDDEHKICNKKYAEMLGYKSVKQWVDNPYPLDDVDQKDQPKGIKAFMSASEKLQAQVFNGTFVKKNPSTSVRPVRESQGKQAQDKGSGQGKRKFKAEIIMAPFVYKKEVFVIHFISPKK